MLSKHRTTSSQNRHLTGKFLPAATAAGAVAVDISCTAKGWVHLQMLPFTLREFGIWLKYSISYCDFSFRLSLLNLCKIN